jgi:hypothetical protein
VRKTQSRGNQRLTRYDSFGPSDGWRFGGGLPTPSIKSTPSELEYCTH